MQVNGGTNYTSLGTQHRAKLCFQASLKIHSPIERSKIYIYVNQENTYMLIKKSFFDLNYSTCPLVNILASLKTFSCSLADFISSMYKTNKNIKNKNKNVS